MKKHALMALATLCVALPGCDSKPAADAAKPAPSVAAPRPPEAPAAAPASGTAKVAAATAREGDSPSNPCKGNKCEVTITVNSCTDIVATPDPIYIEFGNKAKVHWTLDAASYEFTANGIAWKDAAGKNQFDTKEADKKEFGWKDKNVDKGKYDYRIELKGPDPKPCVKDPTVFNG